MREVDGMIVLMLDCIDRVEEKKRRVGGTRFLLIYLLSAKQGTREAELTCPLVTSTKLTSSYLGVPGVQDKRLKQPSEMTRVGMWTS